MQTTGRASALSLIALSACVSSGQQVELAGVAPQPQSVRSRAPATVDLVPIETQVVAYPGHRLAGGGAALALRSAVTSALPPALGARRYRLASVIDRGGRFARAEVGQAMTVPELAATQVALLRHSQAQRSSPDRLLTPALPHRLGEATGSSATLFVAAWESRNMPPWSPTPARPSTRSRIASSSVRRARTSAWS